VLGDDLHRVVHGWHGVGDAKVETGPSQRREVFAQDLTDEGVGEPEGARALTRRHQKPVGDRRFQAIEAGVGGLARCPAEQVEVALATDDGSSLQQLDGRVGQLADAVADHVTNTGRHLGRALAVGQESGKLLDEKRVPVGPAVQGLQGGVVRAATDRLLHQISGGRRPQTGQAEANRPRSPGDGGEGVDDGISAAELELTHGAHEQQGGVVQAVDHTAE
jgi:hypothetical protein